ncbi:MAG TPA: hypothetical protein VF021_03110 [Longimicrobiales bacterium]
MPDASRMIDRLPSLYRPEPDDDTLLMRALQAIASELEEARDQCSMIMPAHWSLHADHALFDPWFTLRRARAGLPSLAPADVVDFVDARAVMIAIKDAHTPLTQQIKADLAPALVADLDAWNDLEPPPVALQRRVLDALNRRNAAVTAEPLLAEFAGQLRRAQLDLPWVRDLGRLAAVVPLVPWREPPSARESAEAFRIRLERMVALYREGLGTVGAMRAVVEATLPIDAAAPPELRDAPFEIEEFAPLEVQFVDAPTDGPPDQLVGPLMRWQLTNDGLNAVAPTIYITGLTPGAGISATTDPMIELFAVAGTHPRIGIGYNGTIAPDATLRLRPSYATWTIGSAGLQRADHLPAAAEADPSTPGNAASVAGAPADIVAIAHSNDGMLWAAADHGTTLTRFDGSTWTEIANSLATIRCFAVADDTVLIGTADGLLEVAVYPDLGDDPTPVAVDGFDNIAIRVIGPVQPDGVRMIGTDDGLLIWNGHDAPAAVAVGGGAGLATSIHALHYDSSGNVQLAAALGAFEYQPASQNWYWYAGAEASEQTPEWQPFGSTPDTRPAANSVFLPEVLAVHRGPDASLWLGTAAGIARYVAHEVSGVTFTTLLEAFPDLSTGAVTQIFEDERRGVWFCTDRGLLRYDGRDWWQRRNGAWAHLGRADLLAGSTAQPRGAWRFDRGSAQWQRLNSRSNVFVAAAMELRTTAEPAVSAVLVTNTVSAHIGALAGEEFAAASAVASSDLYLHVQPSEDRIASGGIPFIPRLPVGTSTWRYLTREPADLVPAAVEQRPAWSMEGRLFPPPPSLDAPYAGRWDVDPPADGNFDQAVFSYDPAARVAFAFGPTQTCSVLVRLRRRPGDPNFDPAILDRVWEGMQLVRPAGIRTRLAVDETIVRGS